MRLPNTSLQNDMAMEVLADFILVNDVGKDIKLLEITVMSTSGAMLHSHQGRVDSLSDLPVKVLPSPCPQGSFHMVCTC